MDTAPRCTNKISGNIFTREMVFHKVGDRNQGHKHTYDHYTILTSGSVQRVIDDIPDQEFRAPSIFLTPKDQVHQFIALEPNTVVLCFHILKDENGVPLPEDIEDAHKYMAYVIKQIDENTTVVYPRK
jgi:quercetin dioxygenase-like cupin family protein